MEAGFPSVATIDTHAHTSMGEFDRDRDAVVTRAKAAGVSFVEVGFDVDSSGRALELARSLGGKCAVGIHPHNLPGPAESLAEAWGRIETLLGERNPEIAAIGEVGLDFSRGSPDRDAQIECFSRGVDLACRSGLPVVVHERDAEAEVGSTLRRFSTRLPVIFHCFTGNKDYAGRCLDVGGFLGFGGIVTYPRNGDLRDTLKFIPPDRILLETDSPYLAPQSHRGSRNEPAFVIDVRDRVANVLGVPAAELSDLTTANAGRAFLAALAFRRSGSPHKM